MTTLRHDYDMIEKSQSFKKRARSKSHNWLRHGKRVTAFPETFTNGIRVTILSEKLRNTTNPIITKALDEGLNASNLKHQKPVKFSGNHPLKPKLLF